MPSRKFLKNTCSEITSESILRQLWLYLMCIKQEYTQDHFHTVSYIATVASYICMH